MQNAEKIGVLDFETDPFLAGRIPYPFAGCVYFSAKDHRIIWEPNIIRNIIKLLRSLPACVLYAHNGGKFDFHFLLENADAQEIQIRNGRITQMQIGNVTLKDSWPLLPFKLEEYRKTKIDYAIFEKTERNKPKNKTMITSYLLDDCINLLELVKGFHSLVGPKDTIGSAAFFQMRQHGLKIWHSGENHDAMFRDYYFGGRVQAFKRGIFRGSFLYLDINSAYPYAMKQKHAHGGDYARGDKLPPRSILGQCFIHCIAQSKGALPLRNEDGSMEFPAGEFEFKATGWEILAGLETKTLRILKILDVWLPTSFICFDDYVDHFFALKQKAKTAGDAIKTLAYKYLLNAGYGKFATNPREFKTYRLAPFGVNVPGFDWESDYGAVSIWSQSSYIGFGFFDVSTSASITGYVRAMLWRAICGSKKIMYADTDAILCRTSNVKRGDALGEWKLEGRVKRAAIAGKKLYGLEWSGTVKPGEHYKTVSKGARLTWHEILAICSGKTVKWSNAAPTFSITGPHFLQRKIRST